ncbi:AcrR family transcriptional regulator [Agromyces sp. 3263]|uniref:TetR/AcrR family transcriptional regulator n=1 Tax=Agromyces sp. 3263 TaxID=2817750 RepID=UPI0028652952|nr:TetR/AcrR family transcriptional regulator [Agromyces sp. 3263]MDR6906794.1 AcrR family transcriptional regulator [Agromyces sp. 3263]
MPKVTEAHRAARRDEIVAAALRCFAAKGYQRTSMADVIEESGLSAGAIYGYFTGKQELFAAVAGRILEARQGELEQQRARGEPLAPGQVMATLIDGMRREPFGHVIVQLWAEAAIDPEIGELVQAVLMRVRETVRQRLVEWATAEPGRVDGDPGEWASRVTPVMIGLAPGFMIQRAIVPGFDEEAFLAALPEVLPH